MKKIATFLTIALIFSMCSTTVIAAKHTNGKNFVDADGDGTCDNMKYSIKYKLNGRKNSKKNPSCYYNTTKTIKLKKPTKKAYTFKGWYADKQCRKK